MYLCNYLNMALMSVAAVLVSTRVLSALTIFHINRDLRNYDICYCWFHIALYVSTLSSPHWRSGSLDKCPPPPRGGGWASLTGNIDWSEASLLLISSWTSGIRRLVGTLSAWITLLIVGSFWFCSEFDVVLLTLFNCYLNLFSLNR